MKILKIIFSNKLIKYILKLITPKFIIDFIKDFFWRQKHLGVKITPGGTKIILDSFMDHLVFKEIFIDGIYDEFISVSLQNMHSNKEIIIWDLGANLGFFSIRFCEICKELGITKKVRLNLIEPAGNCYLRLQDNLKLFQKDFQFRIYNNLIGKKVGADWFVEDKDHHLGQCVNEFIEKDGGRFSRKIGYKDFSEELSSSPITLLKCDIEGSEIDFLSSYEVQLPLISHVVIETHGISSRNFVLNFMDASGFKLLNDYDKDKQFSNLFFKNTSL